MISKQIISGAVKFIGAGIAAVATDVFVSTLTNKLTAEAQARQTKIIIDEVTRNVISAMEQNTTI